MDPPRCGLQGHKRRCALVSDLGAWTALSPTCLTFQPSASGCAGPQPVSEQRAWTCLRLKHTYTPPSRSHKTQSRGAGSRWPSPDRQLPSSCRRDYSQVSGPREIPSGTRGQTPKPDSPLLDTHPCPTSAPPRSRHRAGHCRWDQKNRLAASGARPHKGAGSGSARRDSWEM